MVVLEGDLRLEARLVRVAGWTDPLEFLLAPPAIFVILHTKLTDGCHRPFYLCFKYASVPPFSNYTSYQPFDSRM